MPLCSRKVCRSKLWSLSPYLSSSPHIYSSDAFVLFALGPLFGHKWQRCFPASHLQEKSFNRPNKFCFLQVYRCSVSYERSSLPYPPFLIGSFNPSLRGSRRTAQTKYIYIHSLFTL